MQNGPTTKPSRPRGRPSKKRKRAQDDDDGRKSLPKGELDGDAVRKYLDDNAASAFSVQILPRAKKPAKDTEILHDLFEPRLTTYYTVQPRNEWEFMKKFKRFTLADAKANTVSIGVGEHILVKHDDSSENELLDTHLQWKAQVLETRALDTEHVFVLVAWLNRPEDLQGGRKDYHGKMELIPTNQLDVIDAMCVNGQLKLSRWNEDSDPVSPDQYFWRQTYDAAYTKQYSKLKLICKDRIPQNPDDTTVQCPNCEGWLHAGCIVEDALYKEDDTFTKQTKAAKRSQAQPTTVEPMPGSSAVAKMMFNDLSAELYIKGAPLETGDKLATANGDAAVPTLPAPSDTSLIRIHRMKYAPKEIAVHCLLCQEIIP